ncbi:methyltransferase [Sciscionella marina]|uniref:methyltransferase n=1 Tax=Sciscionella marina TaxID=508770 RepID=UPI001F099F12|nr:class I SAM-dependent methyltransferase [Sciscionella marina]
MGDRPGTTRTSPGAGPGDVVRGTDELTADAAYRLARSGTRIEWHGDYQNARQLLAAMGRRARKRRPPRDFAAQRRATAEQAEILGRLLIPVEPGCVIPLRRAPDVREACLAAGCPSDEAFPLSLRELLGMIGAQQWREKGVYVPALSDRIHPHYGVFSPVRGEYVDLVAEAPLPGGGTAFDIGTGTGVLAAVLARRGLAPVLATDTNPRAIACARDNIDRLGLADVVEVRETDLFPPARADLVVCNPPWVPSAPSSELEQGIYDPGSRMLRAFLTGLVQHLNPGGEGWLILSDLAEHLGLRGREELNGMFATAGLTVAGRLEASPKHKRSKDSSDPLHAARAAERTVLWRLRAQS